MKGSSDTLSHCQQSQIRAHSTCCSQKYYLVLSNPRDGHRHCSQVPRTHTQQLRLRMQRAGEANTGTLTSALPLPVTSSSPERGTRGQVVQLPRSSHWGGSGLTLEVGTDPRGAYLLLFPQNRASDRAPSPADGCAGRVLQGNVLSVLLCLSQCGKC